RVAVCHQRKVRCFWSPDRQEDSPRRNRSADGLQLSLSGRERLRQPEGRERRIPAPISVLAGDNITERLHPPSSQARAFMSIQTLYLTAAACGVFRVQRLTGRRGG